MVPDVANEILLNEALPVGHWRRMGVLGRHWHNSDADKVQCGLCPRHCKLKDGQFGFCGVRGVSGDKLYTYNYAKSVTATVETVETEAVYHYSPGARILALGNVGCMMQCDFCQNWETSQTKHLKAETVKTYSSQQIVDICKAHEIGVVSWTYNDPVVWHEFVVDTSRLLQKHGIKTLFKSAFYIERAPVEELLECIDIFSISLKSMDPEFYAKITKGRLEPVLDRIKQVHASSRHLEISNLVVTGRNDRDQDVRKTVSWVMSELGPDVPLHFVAFHPAYRYTDVARTPPEVLYRARQIALANGIKHCYLGNLYKEGAANTHCTSCGQLLVDRFGLTTKVVGLNAASACTYCGTTSNVRFPLEGQRPRKRPADFSPVRSARYMWNNEVNTLHIESPGPLPQTVHLVATPLNGHDEQIQTLGSGLQRVAISRASERETGVELSWDLDVDLRLLPILDRAHFPIEEDLETNLKGIRERNQDGKAKRALELAPPEVPPG